MAKNHPTRLGKLAKNIMRKREPMGRSRRRANRIAAAILEKETFITSSHILKCLESWKFHRNNTRRNVFPSVDTEFVWSDTLGLVATRDSQRIVLTKASLAYPSFFKLLCRFVECHHDHAKFKQQRFAFTSININFGFGCRLHRDTYNRGPSITKSFGAFTGGRLFYYPDDDGRTTLEDLRPHSDKGHAVALQTSRDLVLFEGRRSHSVEDFVGVRDRKSVV